MGCRCAVNMAAFGRGPEADPGGAGPTQKCPPLPTNTDPNPGLSSPQVSVPPGRLDMTAAPPCIQLCSGVPSPSTWAHGLWDSSGWALDRASLKRSWLTRGLESSVLLAMKDQGEA